MSRPRKLDARFGLGVPGSGVEELTVKESRRLFDLNCRQSLGVSGREYLRRVDTNTLPDDWPSWKVCWLSVIEPFGRA